MLNLPPKRWKKVRLEDCGGGRYCLTFLTSLKNRQEFRSILKDDIEMCLDEKDKVLEANWEAATVYLEIADYPAFQRRLIYINILIEEQRGAP
ncbi:MAG: hypothetical protein ABIK12_00085 [Pseudomonadota bacterium]